MNTNEGKNSRHHMLLRLVFLILSWPALLASSSISLDTIHTALTSEQRELFHLQNETLSSGNMELFVADGFLLLDSFNSDTWQVLGEEGTFHPSLNQDPNIDATLLFSTHLRLKHRSDSAFKLCRLFVSKARAFETAAHLKIQMSRGNPKVITEQTMAMAETGTFITVDLSSQGINELSISALDKQLGPVLMVVGQIIVDGGSGRCD